MTDRPPPGLPDALTPVIAAAVATFRADMLTKAREYGLPAPCVLLTETAAAAGLPPWEVWHAWSMRHTVAIRQLLHQATFDPTPDTCQYLHKRLQDLFGHCLVGLYLCQHDQETALQASPPNPLYSLHRDSR